MTSIPVSPLLLSYMPSRPVTEVLLQGGQVCRFNAWAHLVGHSATDLNWLHWRPYVENRASRCRLVCALARLQVYVLTKEEEFLAKTGPRSLLCKIRVHRLCCLHLVSPIKHKTSNKSPKA
ncbi:hypothetical protein VTK56DRAFT_60 [Thermocarpiscus australiensis]